LAEAERLKIIEQLAGYFVFVAFDFRARIEAQV
jgi:hypothetical protein